jgi:hypothetical protein
MPSVDQALAARGMLASPLKTATDTISSDQELTFVPYRRLILPADGYAFWVREGVLPSSSAMNSMLMNDATLASDPALQASDTFTVMGSVHYAVDTRQDEPESFSLNRVSFTAEEPVKQFQALAPDRIYIATFRGMRFSFSSKGEFYEQAKLWHYVGNAIYPSMASQIVDDPRTFSPKLIVSNSLPGWLAMQYYKPPYPVEVPMPTFPLYPSFLSDLNKTPPYGVIHIGPEDTDADQAIPSLDRGLNQYQLSRDRVRVSLYGLDDDTAQDWLMAVLGYMRDANVFGLANVPNIKDEKRTQSELLTIAMRKTVLFEVSYNQARIRDEARQLIKRVVPTVIPGQLILKVGEVHGR